jgi:rod shape determining protein RodA
MLIINKKHIKYFDVQLFLISIILMAISIVMIYSASYQPLIGSFKTFYIKQIYWSIIGIAAFLFFSFLNYKKLIQFAYVFYILGLIILTIVLIKGHIGMGAQRWISIAGFRFQPSEFYKIVWCLVIARTFRDFNEEKYGFILILKKSLILFPPFILIFLQPDLGTAVIFLAIWGIVLLFRGIKKSTFFTGIGTIILAVPILWSHMKVYQRKRVLTFLNPEKDPFGSGYHIIQSKIAIGSGGLSGKGFLHGTQSHLNFLPERHTDFIFSLINEEFGLIGGVAIIILFGILIFRILIISNILKEPTAKLLCISVVSFIFFQFFVNAAMVLGLMPVVGIPMPFMSYGGSSLLTIMSMLGIVNSASMRRFDNIADI